MQFGLLGLGADHPGVRPARCPLLGEEALAGGAGGDRFAFFLKGEVLVLPGGANLVVAAAEGLDLLGGIGPVFADVGLLFLQQVDRRIELFFVQLVGVFDFEIRGSWNFR